MSARRSRPPTGATNLSTARGRAAAELGPSRAKAAAQLGSARSHRSHRSNGNGYMGSSRSLPQLPPMKAGAGSGSGSGSGGAGSGSGRQPSRRSNFSSSRRQGGQLGATATATARSSSSSMAASSIWSPHAFDVDEDKGDSDDENDGMPWKTPRRRASGGFVTRSQLLKARRDARWQPAGMKEKTAGVATGVVYTTQDQLELMREMMGTKDVPPAEDTHAEKRKMLAASLKKFRRPGMEYVDNPLHKTRSELLNARRAAMLPPMSYDFNGDGVVDNFELFLGRRIDVNGDGKLSDTERANAAKILEDIKEHFVFGLDAAGANHTMYADIEQRAKREAGDNTELDLARKQRENEALLPPWAVSARRAFHDSARSGFGGIGVAYTATARVKREKQLQESMRKQREALLFAKEAKAKAAQAIGSSRPPTGMSSKSPKPEVNGPASFRSSQAPPSSRPATGMSRLIGM